LARLNQTIREAGAQNGVLVIDLARKMPGEYNCDAAQCNGQGSRVVASQIAAHLIPRNHAFGQKAFSQSGEIG
jgi:hypothetical protein